jgi:hypothetical protein
MCGRNKWWKIGNKNLFFLYLPPKSKVRFFGSRTAVCVGIGHQTVLYHPISIITLSNKNERVIKGPNLIGPKLKKEKGGETYP